MAQQKVGDQVRSDFSNLGRDVEDRATLGPQRRAASSAISNAEDRAKSAVRNVEDKVRSTYNKYNGRLENYARKSNSRSSGRR